ncbi:MAG TPA: hypothetical protein VNK41_08400 [Vicinamibacterales bacterium]|nr:hypothetical protein [Vicinamibacterales bacterium]
MMLRIAGNAGTGAAASRRRTDILALAVVLAAAALLWLPRFSGPIDLRWDGAVYYILGTSLAEGRGYKLLNEPGEIDAVQYPPLLPAIVAACQVALGTSDPVVVGRWLRLSSFLVFLVFAGASFRFLRDYLPAQQAAPGALISVMCVHAWFLSDMLFPEVWFTAASLLFLILARRDGATSQAPAYICAVAACALRTIGLAALAAWVLDSALRRRFGQAAVRAALAAVPVLFWQGYLASVERSEAYRRPAYAYQRAPYLFYNVSYARNIALRDPFTPEKGDVQILRRVARNALALPVHVGGTLSVSRGYGELALHTLFGDGRIIRPLIVWSTFAVLYAFGAVVLAGGAVVLWRQRHHLVLSYVALYLAALCMTPFPQQNLRYLMPITPMLALFAIALLNAVAERRTEADRSAKEKRLLSVAPWIVIALQVAVVAAVHVREYRPAAYEMHNGVTINQRLFYYDDAQEGFDRAVDYVDAHADRDDVVAAGVPHWIHLRTGLKTVMPPFEADAASAQTLLDSVPVDYLLVGSDVIASERYTVPVVRQCSEAWELVFTSRVGGWKVYRRTERTPPPSCGTRRTPPQSRPR